MINWILAVLALYTVQTMLPAAIRFGSKDDKYNPKLAAGARDALPEPGVKAQRGYRALENMKEALFIFIPLALLLVHQGVTGGIGLIGVIVFFCARAAYVPAYIFDPPMVRSLCWLIGWAGMIMMVIALLAD